MYCLKIVVVFCFLGLSWSCKKESYCTEGSCPQPVTTDLETDSVANLLISLIEPVSSTTGFSFQSKDDEGNSMDCAKIIEYQNDTFIAIYHTLSDGIFYVHIAISADLLHWKHQVVLGERASQPAIFYSAGNKFYVAWEQEPDNHIRVLAFDNFKELTAGNFSLQKDIQHTFSSCAEGTPNFYRANDSVIEMGYHYFCSCDVDRQAKGTLTHFSDWSTGTEPCIDHALLIYNLNGNIGDRDAFTFMGNFFLMMEAQEVKDDFGTWKLFLFSPETNQTYPVNVQTPANSKSFSNATISILDFHQQPVVVFTAFIHAPGSGANESGEMICYQFL